MKDERMTNLAARIREAKDPALEAVYMVNHISGTGWANTWSCLSLLRNAIKAGGTLVLPSFGPDDPERRLTVPELVERLSAHLQKIPADIDALAEALKASTPNTPSK